MADQIPLVLDAGQLERLQSGDDLTDQDGNAYPTAAAAFGTDDVLLASDGTGVGVKATAIDKDDVVTAPVAFGTDAQLIESEGVGKGVANSGINSADVTQAFTDIDAIEADYVSAASAFGTDDVLLASDGVSRGAKSTGIDKDNVVTAAAGFGTDNSVPRSDGTVKALQSSGLIVDDSANMVVGSGTTYTLLVGSLAGDSSTLSSVNNIFIGANSGRAATLGANNVGLGAQSQFQMTGNGSNSLAIGSLSMSQEPSRSLGSQQVGIGYSSLRNAQSTLGGDNVAVGAFALSTVTAVTATTPSDNVGIGRSTGANATMALNNVFICNQAGSSCSVANNNVAIGVVAFSGATATNQNVGIGVSSFQGATIGSDNTGIGRNTGRSLNSTGANENVFIGTDAGNNGSQGTAVTNSVAIGSGSFTTASNQVVLGASTISATTLRGAITGYSAFNTAFVFNEPGADADFRFEGDTLTHMLFGDASAATENIALLAAAAPNWQGMDRGLFVGDSTTAPSGNPSSGVFLYSSSGDLVARNTQGAVTTLSGETRGATASVADGGTITHNLGTTPTGVVATGSVAGEIITVTALGATTFTLAVKQADGTTAGTSQTIYWKAFK